MRYNYVVLGNGSDLYKVSYADLNKIPGAVYLTGLIDTDSVILNRLFRIHNSDKINSLFRVPGRALWNRLVFTDKFSEKKPICFVFRSFLTRKKNLESGIIPYLKKKYPDCKIVIFCQDLIRFEYSYYKRYIEEFDLAISFDQEDARRYGMLYYPLVYSSVSIPESSGIANSDVYFLGKAKDRLDYIIESYEVLTNAGMKCDFNIVGVPDEKKRYKKDINYIEGMSYIDNLRHIDKTKCMLEIMQGGGHGYTQRYAEAIMYGKKLITNNVEIIHAPFYSEDNVLKIDTPSDIDVAFLKDNTGYVDYKFKEQLSPIKLIEFIDSRL